MPPTAILPGAGVPQGSRLPRITPRPVGGPAPGSLVPAAPQAPRTFPATNQNTGFAPPPMARPQTQGIQVPQQGARAPVYGGIPTNQSGGGLQQNPTTGQWGVQTAAGGAPPASGGFAPGYRNPATNIPNAPPGANVIQLPNGQHKTTGGAMPLEQIAATARHQQQLIGDPELAARLGINPETYSPLTRGDLGLAQVGEYARQERLAEGDLSQGVGYLNNSLQRVGTDPASMLAMQIAMNRAQSGGEFSDQYLDQQRGLIRNRGGVAAQTAERSLAEDMARRGVQGPLAGLYSAQLAQQNAMGVQGQLGDFEQNAAVARDEAERAALGQLEGISARQEQERLGIEQALANSYLQNERSPIDFSPAAVEPRKKKSPVGGKAKNTSTIGRG